MSQSRPRFGCFPGSFSPSRRHRRSTRLSLTLPAGVAQQGGDPAIAVTAVPTGQLDHVRNQAILVVTAARDTALGRAVLPQHPAGPPFRDPEPATGMVDALAAARGAQRFPRAAFVRICLSSVRSETARRSRSFSFSSAAETAELIAAHPAILLAPAVVCDLADPQLPDRVRHRHARAEPPPAAACRRSPPACSASSPSLVPLIPKPKDGPIRWGRITVALRRARARRW